MKESATDRQQINLLIAEMDDLGVVQQSSIQQFLVERNVSTDVAEVVQAHFANADRLRQRLQGTKVDSKRILAPSAPRTIGPYRLESKLGEGGMGSVWLAHQSAPLERQVAIKLMRPGVHSDELLRRFENERQMQASLDHPHIAKVLDAGTTPQGAPYFVMEFLKGDSLTSYCGNKNLELPDKLSLFLALCSAIQHAHQKGLIHRDVKPSNVIVCEIDGKPVVKVIDFGLARMIDNHSLNADERTRLGTVLGSLPYMSPEQAKGASGNADGQDVDTRTDVYSLGAVLYELLTGTTPIPISRIKQIGVVETLRTIQETPPTWPSERVQELENAPVTGSNGTSHFRQLVGDLDWVIVKALEIDRNRRFDTVAEFARDIERFIDNEPVSARPPSRTYLLTKFVQKNQVMVTASVFVVAALVVGLAVALWQAGIARAANTTLKQRNTDLKNSIQQVRQLEQSRIEDYINSLLSRGQWVEAREALRDVKAKTNELPPSMQLAELTILDGLQKTDELKAAIANIDSPNWPGQYAGERDLWVGYGYLLDRSFQGDPSERIRLALASGTLDAADKLFARGLIAESSDESIRLFKESLAVSSFHLRSRIQLVVELILSGRRLEAERTLSTAKEIFPNDARFYHANALNYAIWNRRKEAQAAIEEAKTRFPEISTDYIDSALKIFEEFNRLLATLEEGKPAFAVMSIATRMKALSVTSSNEILMDEFYKPKIFEAFSLFLKKTTSFEFLFGNNSKKLLLIRQACQQSYRIYPDDVFLYMEGVSYFAIGKGEEARQRFLKAMNGRSLLSTIANESRFFVFACGALEYKDGRENEALEKAVEYLEDYEISALTETRFDLICRALLKTGRSRLVRRYFDAMINQGGNEKELLFRLASYADDFEELGLAFQTWDELANEFPDDLEIKQKRNELIQKLADQGKGETAKSDE